MSRLRTRLLLLVLASPAAHASAAKPDETPARPAKKQQAQVAEAPAPAKEAAAQVGKGRPRAAKDDAAAAPAGDARPTPEEIQKTFDAGDYTGTLQQVSRVIKLKGDAAAGYDPYTLWMLKGESHLQLKQLKQAGEAFGFAAKATKDGAEAAKARATQRMLAEAKAYQVKRHALRRGEKPQSADILDPAQREQAFRILYEDARVLTEPMIKAALKARELPPIATALKALADGHDLELAATGGKAELSGAREDVTKRARELIDRELVDMQQEVETIREEANRTVERRTYSADRRGTAGRYDRGDRPRTAAEARRAARRDMKRRVDQRADAGRPGNNASGGSYTRVIKRGLTEGDRKDLIAAIEQCKKILPTLEELAEAARVEVDEFDDLIKLTKEVGTLAERTLNDRYQAEN